MSKLELVEGKEWHNIDYTNTTGYKTVKAYNKGVFHGNNELNAPPGGIPSAEFRQLKFLKMLDGKVRKDKGPVLKRIRDMHRKLVQDFDQYGKKVSKEYLTISGEFRGTTWNNEQEARSFTEGWYRKPVTTKTYKLGKSLTQKLERTLEGWKLQAQNWCTITKCLSPKQKGKSLLIHS